MVKKISKKSKIILIIAVFAFQIVIWVYWGMQKSNLYIDDLFSLGYIQNCTDCDGMYGSRQYFILTDKWKTDQWLYADDIKNELVLDENEYITNTDHPLKYLIPPTEYYEFINFIQCIFPGEGIRLWPAFIVNMVLMILTEVIIAILLRKLGCGDICTLLGILMYGVSIDIVGLITYVRFYIWALFFVWCVLLLTYKALETKKIQYLIIYDVFSGLCIITAVKATYLTFVVFGAIFGGLAIALLLRQEWGKAFFQWGCIVLAFIYFMRTSSLIDMIINISDYAGNTQKGNLIADFGNRVVNANIDQGRYYIDQIVHWLEEYRFGSKWGLALCTIILTMAVLWALKNKHGISLTNWYSIAYIVATLAMVIILLLDINKTQVIGLGIYIIASIIIMYMSGAFEWKDLLETRQMFMLIVAFTLGVYNLFGCLSYIVILRYNCFSLVLIWLILWYVVSMLISTAEGKSYRVGIVTLAVYIMSQLLCMFWVRNVPFIYEEDRVALKNIQQHDDLDVVVTDSNNMLSLYDCIYNVAEDIEVYATSENTLSKEKINSISRDQFLLWEPVNAEDDCITELSDAGYSCTDMGYTHESHIYLCEQSE